MLKRIFQIRQAGAYLALCLAFVLAGCAQTRNSGGLAAHETGGAVQVSEMDASFAREACQMGVTEMEIGKLAAQNTKTKEIREFARKLWQERARSEKEVARLLKKKGLPPEGQLAEERLAVIEKLASLKGRQFDEAFKAQVIRDQEKEVAILTEQAERGDDPDLRAFARGRLEWARQTLAQAHALPIGESGEEPEVQTGVPAVLNNPSVRLNGFSAPGR
jgi:putative membrane protein